MLFYFSNVERQRTFSFSEFFCYDFFIRGMEEEHSFGRALSSSPTLPSTLFPVFEALAISRVDITYNTTVFSGILSRYSSFFHRSRKCQAIQL